mgnify:CR=1 FL=1
MPAPTAPPPALPLQIGAARLGAGQVLTVAGPSGAGKSTLLARIAGLIPPAPEQPIMLAGRPVTATVVTTPFFDPTGARMRAKASDGAERVKK